MQCVSVFQGLLRIWLEWCATEFNSEYGNANIGWLFAARVAGPLFDCERAQCVSGNYDPCLLTGSIDSYVGGPFANASNATNSVCQARGWAATQLGHCLFLQRHHSPSALPLIPSGPGMCLVGCVCLRQAACVADALNVYLKANAKS